MTYPSNLPLHEIWEEIAYHLDSTRDLLSLALTSRTFNLLIIPYHLEYRRIRCDLRYAYVWEHLSIHLHRTKGIRSVEFEFKGIASVLLPKSLRYPPEGYIYHSFVSFPADIIRMIVTSIFNMPFLTRFVWNHPVVDGLDGICRAIAEKKDYIQELSINVSWQSHKKLSDYIDSLPIWQLPNLTSVILCNPCLAAQKMLAANCPNIENLCLSKIPTDPSSWLFKNARWSKLRRLTIKGNMVYLPLGDPEIVENGRILCAFLARHQSLRSVWISIVELPILPVMVNLLSIGWNVSLKRNSLLLLPEALLSRVQNLQLSIRDIGPGVRMENLETLFISISFEIPSYFSLFLQDLPRLKKLYTNLTYPLNPDGEDHVIKALVHCKSLTHLYATCLFTGYKGPWDVAERLLPIRTLKYFQGIVNDKDLFMMLHRTETGEYCGYRLVDQSEEGFGQPPGAWGDYFFSFWCTAVCHALDARRPDWLGFLDRYWKLFESLLMCIVIVTQ